MSYHIELGTWIIVGGLVGVLPVVLIAACILSKKYIKSAPLPTTPLPENKGILQDNSDRQLDQIPKFVRHYRMWFMLVVIFYVL